MHNNYFNYIFRYSNSKDKMKSTKRFYVIVNPHGGARRGLRILDKVKPIFESNNCEIAILETQFAGHAENMQTNYLWLATMAYA